MSAKTLDTTTLSCIADPRRIYSTLRQSIDAATTFEGYQLRPVELCAGDIGSRTVSVAVSLQTDAAQWEQIQRAVNYAKERGIRLEPEIVTNSALGR